MTNNNSIWYAAKRVIAVYNIYHKSFFMWQLDCSNSICWNPTFISLLIDNQDFYILNLDLVIARIEISDY